MRLREIRIEASDAVSDHGVVASDLVFRWTAHHVREIFSALLPREFTLDGSSVVQITCGPPQDDQEQYHQVLGSSEYFVPGFDFAAYKKASAGERERCLLDVVEAALCDIAARAGTGSDAVRATAQAVRDCGFRLECEIPRLRKSMPASRHVLRVLRCLSAEWGESWFLRSLDRKGALLGEAVMGKTPYYLDRRNFYHRAEVHGAEYVVYDRLGRETFRFRDA